MTPWRSELLQLVKPPPRPFLTHSVLFYPPASASPCNTNMLLQWCALEPTGEANLAAIRFSSPVRVQSIKIFPANARPFAQHPEIIRSVLLLRACSGRWLRTNSTMHPPSWAGCFVWYQRPRCRHPSSRWDYRDRSIDASLLQLDLICVCSH